MVTFRRVETPATVSVLGLSLGETPLAEIACLAYNEPLEIHPPDRGFPERMLTVCPHCRAWYL